MLIECLISFIGHLIDMNCYQVDFIRLVSLLLRQHMLLDRRQKNSA